LDGGGHDLVQAQEVSMAARVSAAKCETRRSEGEVGRRRFRRGMRDRSIKFDA
jgi:hypothetical protein